MDFKYKIADVAKEFDLPAKKVIETVSPLTGEAYKTGGTKDDQSRLAAARADREETRGKIEKMKMEEAQGDLHRTEDVERGLKAIFANFKNRLETIPTKYAKTMAQLTDPVEAHDILQKAVEEALVELSNPDIALAEPEKEPEDEQEE